MKERRRMAGLVGIVMSMLLLVSGARGAEMVTGRILSVGIGGANGKGGLYRPGTWVPVRVHVENRTAGQFVGSLAVEQKDLDGDKVLSIGPELILPAGDPEGRDVWVYYWPGPDDENWGVKSVMVLNGKDKGSQIVGTITADGPAGAGIAEKDNNNGHSQRLVVLLGNKLMGFGAFVDAYGGTQSVRYASVQNGRQLPDNVLGYDGVDAIVWQADAVKPSDIPPDFQMKAILEWVRAGGHLIITVGTQQQEFLKADERLRGALPMTLMGTREVKLEELNSYPGISDLNIRRGRFSDKNEKLVQAIGTLNAGARVASGQTSGAFDKYPLVVTAPYGQGAVTMLTVDAGNPYFEREMSPVEWMIFWNQVAGWQGQLSAFVMDKQRAEDPKNPVQMNQNPGERVLGRQFGSQVDVTEVTASRFFIAVLFLGLYWLAAGPLGHLALRHYKVVHWSWWIFGATVVVAGAVAGMVVIFLQLTNYDLRHKTVVIGTVGSKEVSVVGFYGVFAPGSGEISVTQPGKPGEAGMNYLAPLCLPTGEGVKPFADPKTYALSDDRPNETRPVFRNTLKKMQGRWKGELDGIEGSATCEGAGFTAKLKGTLTNKTGYDLENVEILVHTPDPRGPGRTLVFHLAAWGAGKTLDLAKDATNSRKMLDQDLADIARPAKFGGIPTGMGSPGETPVDPRDKNRRNEWLNVLLEAKKLDSLNSPERGEVVRGPTRAMECAKLLYASGALIVATAGNIETKDYVKNPVPVSVNRHVIEGKGDVLFVWALPLEGKAAKGMLEKE